MASEGKGGHGIHAGRALQVDVDPAHLLRPPVGCPLHEQGRPYQQVVQPEGRGNPAILRPCLATSPPQSQCQEIPGILDPGLLPTQVRDLRSSGLWLSALSLPLSLGNAGRRRRIQRKTLLAFFCPTPAPRPVLCPFPTTHPSPLTSVAATA